jgi:hypothetical protein
MADPLEDDDIFELPEGDAKVRLPKEEGEEKERRAATGKPTGAPGDDLDDEEQPQDQLGMARRHARRLERKLGTALKANLDLQTRVREHDELLNRLTRSTLHSDLRSVQGSVEAAEQQLITARDDGDRQKELAAERILAQERSRLATLERAVSSADQEREPAPPPAPPAADPRLETAKELADEWSRRRPWYGAQDATEDSEIVRAVSTAIVNDPKNPIDIDDPEHFQELDRRLARRLPERYQRRPARDDADMDDQRPDVSGTRGTSRRANPTQASNGEQPIPTQQQLRVYKEMGFDWNDTTQQERIVQMERKLVDERKDRRHG